MAKICHKESRYNYLKFDDGKAKDMFGAEFGVKCVNPEICGFFLGCKSTFEFSHDPIGMQILFWVRPKSRGTKCFYLLIHAFLNWCKDQNIQPFINPHFSEDNSKTYKMLKKLGLKEFGGIYSVEKK